MSIISRSAAIDSHEGRTLSGLAFYFDRASRVSDDGRSFYLEAFARGSANKSIADRGRFAVGILHPWSSGRGLTSPIPIGAVTFGPGRDGLEFDAVLSRTVAGDEALELVKDGALHDVSVSARPIRSSRRQDVVWRNEIAIRELSLAPPGMGQHQGAEVLAVRSEIATDAVELDRVEDRRRRARLVFMQ